MSTKRKPLLLENGDCLTRDEFERRYAAMPLLKKAELIEGVVYMPSPVRYTLHGSPHADLVTCLGHYRASTPGTGFGDNSTVRLDAENEPQPDVVLFIKPDHGGRLGLDPDDYLNGSPELVAEVSASTVSIDLGRKLEAYQRNQVQEYIVWRVSDDAIDWFVLRNGLFVRFAPDPADGLLKSVVFPGLWLDGDALLREDLAAGLTALARGLASPEHAAFVRKLAEQRQSIT